MLLLGGVVPYVDLRAELHFLGLDLALVLASLLRLDGLIVLELAVIHDAAHGRFRIRGDFNKIKPLVVSNALRLGNRVDTQLRSVEPDQAALAHRDLFVEPRLLSGYRTHLPSLHAVSHGIKKPTASSMRA